MFKRFLYPSRKGRTWGKRLRGIARRRAAPVEMSRRGCCCCPLILGLGFAAVSLTGGVLYLGMRFLGWA